MPTPTSRPSITPTCSPAPSQRPPSREGRQSGLWRAEGNRPGTQQPQREGRQHGDPLPGGRLEFGQRRRPQVWAFESPEVRNTSPWSDDLPLAADINLLPPVDIAVGQLGSDARVAAKLRAAGVLDRELVRLIEVEEPAGHAQDVVDEGLLDPVPDEIEETDVVGHLPELLPERCRALGALIEFGQVQDGEAGQHPSIFATLAAGATERYAVGRVDGPEPV